MKFILIFAFVLCFVCVISAPVKESKTQAENNNEIDELELELKELQKKVIKLKEHAISQKITTKPIFNPSEASAPATAKPTVAKDTDVQIISIERVRQQNDDEELELEGKQPNKIKPPTGTEPTPTPHKEKIIKEEEKLEAELEKGNLPVRTSHSTKIETQEGTTAEPAVKPTRTETSDVHIISIEKVKQQNQEEELELEGKGSHKTTHQLETEPSPTPHKKTMLEEEEELEPELKKQRLPEGIIQPTNVPVQERTTVQPPGETTVAKDTDVQIISIEKVRQQNHDEELELEGKQPHKIKHPLETEPTPTPDKKAIIEEEEKLDLETKKEKLPERIIHPTKVPIQERTTVQPTAEPEVAKDTDVQIISIERVRQQNDDEELELEGKQPNKIKHRPDTEPTPTPDKKAIDREEEKLELELEKEKLSERITHPKKVPSQEKTTAGPTAEPTKAKDTDLHIISIEKVRQQNEDEERELGGELPHPTKHPLKIEPTPTSDKKATIKEEKIKHETERGKFSGRMTHPTKLPILEKTTAPVSEAKQEVTTESVKQTRQTDSKTISSNELEEEKLLENKIKPKRKQNKKTKHTSDELQEEQIHSEVVKVEKIESRKTSEPKTEAIQTTLPSKTHRQTTQHDTTPLNKHKETTTLKQATTPKREPLHTTPKEIEVSKKPPDNIADLEEELEKQLKFSKDKVARVKKSHVDKDLEKDLREISLH